MTFAIMLATAPATAALGQEPLTLPGPDAPMLPAAVPALAYGVVEDSMRLDKAVQIELGDTAQAQRLRIQINALKITAEVFERTLQLSRSGAERILALREVEQMQRSILRGLSQPGLNAPGSLRIAERIGLKVGALEDAILARPMPAMPASPAPGFADRDTLLAGLRATQAAIRYLIGALDREPVGSPYSGRLPAQLLIWSRRLDEYLRLVETTPPPIELTQARAEFRPIDLAARRIGQQIGNSLPPAPRSVAATWDAVSSALDTVRATLGQGADPGYGPVPGVSTEMIMQRALVREFSGMIAEMDTFLSGLNAKVPEGPQIQAEAFSLRDALARLRRHLNLNVPDRRIVQDLADAVNAHRLLAARVERLNRGKAPGPNVIRIRNIGAALARIRQQARRAT